MIAALDRHLKDKQYPLSIVKDREFHCRSRSWRVKRNYYDRPVEVSAPTKQDIWRLKEGEEEVLLKESKFGSTTPEALVNSMWWLLTQHFGLRGRQEHHDMKVDVFQLCKDDNGVEFVQFTEGQTKTRQGGLHSQHRDFQPRIFAVGGEWCPVALFKQFVSRRPQNLKTTGPFYLHQNKQEARWQRAV